MDGVAWEATAWHEAKEELPRRPHSRCIPEKKRRDTHTSRTTSGSISCRSSSPFSSWQQTSPSRLCREHFAGSGVCTEGPEVSMAHTGGLFFVSVPLAVARGRRTEAGASEDIERRTESTKRSRTQ